MRSDPANPRRGARAALALILVFLGVSAVRGAPREPFRVSRDGDRVVVVDWSAERLREAAAASGTVILPSFPLPAAAPVDLELEPFRVAGPQTRFVLGRKGRPDEPIAFDPASVSLFRGRVPGRPGSSVFLALQESGSVGHVDLGRGGVRYLVGARDLDGEKLPPGHFSVFVPTHLPEPPASVPFCGVDTGEPHLLASPRGWSAGTADLAALGDPAPGLKHMQLAVETDFEYYSLFGNTPDALAYVMQLYGAVSDIYLRDVDTRIELTFVRIWDDPDDLFNDVDPSPLGDFQSYWNANMTGVTRDLAQLFSGRRDYPFGGQATLSALCGSSAYSVVGYAAGSFPDPADSSPYHYDLSVTAHEIGHNAGTGHTHDNPNNIDNCDNPAGTPQRGTIMSYCAQTWSGGNANRDLYFHSTIQQNMDAHIGASNCIVDDCNLNGIDDAIEIGAGMATDANSNNVPDVCEDCNNNGTLDDADIAGASQDIDSNGIPDECQPDCNANGVPDAHDIAQGTSTDLYGNDIPDECEADCDASGTSDYTEIQANMALDIDRDRIPDACQDCDGDLQTDIDELGGRHDIWIASGLTASPARRFHGRAGVLAFTTGGTGNALADEAQDLIHAPGGRILVTSHGDNRVMEFDAAGYVGDLVPPGSGGLLSPTGLVISPDGFTLLVASSGTDEVLAYDLAGGASQGAFVAAAAGGLDAPFGLTFGFNGNLFVTSATDEVLEFDGTSGALVGAFVTAANNGGLSDPRGLAFKPDGDLLVASFGSDQVLAYDGTGAPLGRWALSGNGTNLNQISPWGIRIGPNGNVYVSRTGDSFGSGGGGGHDHLHLTNAQVYEFDATSGNYLRALVSGNDHGLEFTTGFDFAPGWDIDCNQNFLQDDCDISLGTSLDVDMSGVPDECEDDCNGNGVFDRLDVYPFGPAPDCNANLRPDTCDIGDGTSQDCTANGVPDECEDDCNGNGIADSCDVAAGSSYDCDGNGIPDECQVFDDMETDTGWTAGVAGDTASTGVWERVDPIGTSAQPEDDHTPSGQTCWVTGQGSIGGTLGENDVDGGFTTLVSPTYDLAGSSMAEIGYWRWYSNSTGGSAGNDVFVVDISNDGGQSWTNVETVGPSGASGGWLYHSFRVSDFVPPTASVVLRFIAEDAGGGSIVEAAIDDLTLAAECCQTAVDCDDGLACTSEACLPDGRCDVTLDAGNCLIGGACVADGGVNPSNDCEVCAAALPGAWTAAPPLEVQDVILSEVGGATRLDWPAQGTALYDIAGGAASLLRTAGGAGGAQCMVDDLAAVSWDDPQANPASGEIRYYLLRAEKSCGTGTYGTSSTGSERLPVSDCP